MTCIPVIRASCSLASSTALRTAPCERSEPSVGTRMFLNIGSSPPSRAPLAEGVSPISIIWTTKQACRAATALSRGVCRTLSRSAPRAKPPARARKQKGLHSQEVDRLRLQEPPTEGIRFAIFAYNRPQYPTPPGVSVQRTLLFTVDIQRTQVDDPAGPVGAVWGNVA